MWCVGRNDKYLPGHIVNVLWHDSSKKLLRKPWKPKSLEDLRPEICRIRCEPRMRARLKASQGSRRSPKTLWDPGKTWTRGCRASREAQPWQSSYQLSIAMLQSCHQHAMLSHAEPCCSELLWVAILVLSSVLSWSLKVWWRTPRIRDSCLSRCMVPTPCTWARRSFSIR